MKSGYMQDSNRESSKKGRNKREEEYTHSFATPHSRFWARLVRPGLIHPTCYRLRYVPLPLFLSSVSYLSPETLMYLEHTQKVCSVRIQIEKSELYIPGTLDAHSSALIASLKAGTTSQSASYPLLIFALLFCSLWI